MQLARVEILDPLEYIDLTGKRIDPKTLKPKFKRYYLNANLFYSSMNHFVQKDIIEKVKLFLHPHIKDIPVISDYPVEICLEYYNTKTTYDLDNKLYFWNKVIADKLVKDGRVTEAQAVIKKGKTVITETVVKYGKLPDDNVKYISKLTFSAHYGDPKLVIIINTLY